jgi:hypothetical protein
MSAAYNCKDEAIFSIKQRQGNEISSISIFVHKKTAQTYINKYRIIVGVNPS